MIKIKNYLSSLCKIEMSCTRRRRLFNKKEKECLVAVDNTGAFATLKKETNKCNLILFLKTKNSGSHLF